jgi:hypothetical protein
MSMKAFRILAVCTVIAVLGAAWAIHYEWSRWGSDEHGTKVFPALAANLDAVSTIKLRHQGNTLTLERRPDGWVMLESDGFPARSKSIQELLYALSVARHVEPKTAEAKRYPKLEVDDPDGPKAKSLGIEVLDESGKSLASLILGKENLLLQAIGEGGAYIRLPDQKQVWLASGNLIAGKETKDWLENPIIDIPRQRIAKAEITHPNGDVLVVKSTDEGEEKFKLEGLAEDESLISEYYPTDIGRVWEEFEIFGAKKREAIDFPADATIKGRYTAIDGLTILFEMATIDGKDWLRINSVSTTNQRSPEAVAEVKSILDKTKGFAFLIPEFESIHLKKNRSEVVQKSKPQS